jgi:hypothetical protein
MLILIPWKPVVIVWGLLAAVPVGWVRWFVVAGGEEPIFDGPAPFALPSRAHRATSHGQLAIKAFLNDGQTP